MSALPPGWYPDPIERAGLRYFDGTAWTVHRQPGPPQAYPYGPAVVVPRPGMSAGAIVGIVLGAVLLVGMLAAIAIPVFLNQRGAEAGDLSWISCADLAADAVRFSADIEAPGAALLTDVTDLAILRDSRPGLRLPADGREVPMMACTGTGIWEDGATAPISMEFTIDSGGDIYIRYWRL